MQMRQSGEIEVVLGKITVHRVSSGSLKRACDEIDAGSVNQDPSKFRPLKDLRRQSTEEFC
jgi:hypothetical protein